MNNSVKSVFQSHPFHLVSPSPLSLHTKYFSTSQTRKADPLTSATTIMITLNPTTCLALALIANSVVILAGIYNIASEWAVTEVAEIFGYESFTQVQNWVTAVSAYEALVQDLAQSVRVLQEIMPTILPSSSIHLQSSLLLGVTAMHHLLEDAAFHAVGAFSRELEQAAEYFPELINLSDTLEYELWPDLRTVGNELAEFLRWMENTLHIIPSDRSPFQWFEN